VRAHDVSIHVVEEERGFDVYRCFHFVYDRGDIQYILITSVTY